jgi:alpha-N-arabinofuranosidase
MIKSIKTKSMKKKCAFLLLVLVAASKLGLAQQNTISINSAAAKVTISKNIYGHFAEHLGHCIYVVFM